MKKLNKLGMLSVVIMLISVLAITASFSWFTRPNGTKEADSLSLSGVTAVVKSQDCNVKTFASKMENGLLNPSDTEVSIQTDSFSIPAGGVQYFTTVVTNNSGSKTNISLTNLTLNGASSSTNINILSPIKTTMKYQSGMTFAEHLTVDANNTLTVEWYVHNAGGSAITVSFGKLPEVSYYK